MSSDASVITPYEERLPSDRLWAIQQGSMHFEQGSAVQRTLQRFAKRLEELQLSYAILGGMALFLHGYRRFTEDVAILVTRETHRHIQEQFTGLGYLPPFTGSKNLRDAETGVKIEFIIAGEYPGDGLPKPVVSPDPAKHSLRIDQFCVLKLPKLVELKLASGMTNPRRIKDLVDVQELIDRLQLGPMFAEQLDPSVRAKFLELHQNVQNDSHRDD